MVDWSASSKPNKGKNSIWIAIGRAGGHLFVSNVSTRDKAVRRIEQLVKGCLRYTGRVLVGFDFAFGFPDGFSEKAWPGIPGKGWEKSWKGLMAEVKDDNQVKDNGFDRFAIAAKMNERVAGGGGKSGPFWGCPVKSNWISPRKPNPFPPNLERLRVTESKMPGVQETWKLFAPGSVGSQTLVGIPRVADLRFNRFRENSEVWPFETGFTTGNKKVVFAEIWPGTVGDAVRTAPINQIRDAVQVQAMVEWCVRKDDEGKLANEFEWRSSGEPPKKSVLDEEGWILGCTPL